MKNLSLVGLLVSMLAVPFIASAAEFRFNNESSLSSGESVVGNLYMAGSSVVDSGTVKGDFLAAGGTLLVSGAVANDVMVAGGNVTITSDIGGDVRVAGGNVLVQSKVAGDLVAAGGQISVSGGSVGADVAIAGGTITMDVPVNGNAKLAGGNVTINSTIKGNVEIYADKVTLGPKALINGNLAYHANTEATMQEGAVIKGNIDFKKRDTSSTTGSTSKTAIGAFFTLAILAKLLMSFAGALIFFLAFPRYAKDMVRIVAEKPLEELGRGFVAFVVTPIASILLLVTVIGVPIGVLGLLGFAALIIFASLAAPVIVGSFVHTWIWKPAAYEVNWWIILMGTVIYFLVGLVPFVGWILKFVIMLVTLGVVVQIKWDIAKRLR